MGVNTFFRKDFSIIGRKRDLYWLLANIATTTNLTVGLFTIFALAFQISIWSTLIPRAIVLASCLDRFDGKLARLSKYKNRYGEKFDTFADLVTFALAPGLIIVDFLNPFSVFAGVTCGCLYIFAASFRLSRYSFIGGGKVFSGMPTPIAAAFVAVFYVLRDWDPLFIAGSMVLMSLIMMSNYGYTALRLTENRFDQLNLTIITAVVTFFVLGLDSWYRTVSILLLLVIYYFIIIGPTHAKHVNR